MRPYLFFFPVPFDTYIQGNIVLDQSFNPQLNNHSSPEYISLQKKIIAPLQNLYCDQSKCCSVTVTGFRQGSVVAGFLVAIASGGLSNCDIFAKLISQMNSIPATIGGIPVSPGSLSASKSTFLYFS